MMLQPMIKRTTVRFMSVFALAILAMRMAVPVSAITDLASLVDGESDQSFGDSNTLEIVESKDEKQMKLSTFYQFPVKSDDFKGYSQKFSARHPGYDIRAKFGGEIRPVQKGVVITMTYEYGGYGRYVIIEHENGIRTLYAHMSKSFVDVGKEVDQNTVIGLVGSTGRSTGPHIHFEVRSGTAYINPAKLMPEIPVYGLLAIK
ncbi:MAG TPA: M23 family metallopeptidase [Patescibacteria group bacterium]|nr:M23 family metallopeptidase [Patescibacteria group bacterium]